jgi:hypothetical protein
MRPEDPRDLETRVRALRCELAGDRVILAGIRVLLALERRAHFDPAQPRDELGRWADIGRSTTDTVTDPSAVADPAPTDERIRVAGPFDWGPVDLRDEEGRDGAHAISEHVGKPDEKLLARVRGDAWFGFTLDVVRFRDGTFSSLESANKLVNATLGRNADVVEDVAAGRRPDAFVTAEFGSVTGREAYRNSSRSSPYIRTVTGVGVYIIHSARAPRGFRVISAYPRND